MIAQNILSYNFHWIMKSFLHFNGTIHFFYDLNNHHNLINQNIGFYPCFLPHLLPNCNLYRIFSSTTSYCPLYVSTLHLLYPLYRIMFMPPPSCELSKINFFFSYILTITPTTYDDFQGPILLLVHPKTRLLDHQRDLLQLIIFSSCLQKVVLP